jgi:predicted Zn-dependent protease with MMP-like domain
VKKEIQEDFYDLVERALEGLPPELSALLDNVAIIVEDGRITLRRSRPSMRRRALRALRGCTADRAVGRLPRGLPDKITLFRGPLERDFPPAQLEEQVRVTVVHEIAHHFGFDEDRIESWAGDEVSNEGSLAIEQEIDAPAEGVAAYIGDFTNAKEWMVGVEGVERLSEDCYRMMLESPVGDWSRRRGYWSTVAAAYAGPMCLPSKAAARSRWSRKLTDPRASSPISATLR